MRTHAALMFIYAATVALFFSLLWNRGRAKRIRSFVAIFCALFFGGIAVGWLMFPFPLR